MAPSVLILCQHHHPSQEDVLQAQVARCAELAGLLCTITEVQITVTGKNVMHGPDHEAQPCLRHPLHICSRDGSVKHSLPLIRLHIFHSLPCQYTDTTNIKGKLSSFHIDKIAMAPIFYRVSFIFLGVMVCFFCLWKTGTNKCRLWNGWGSWLVNCSLTQSVCKSDSCRG